MNAYTTRGQARIQPSDISTALRMRGLPPGALHSRTRAAARVASRSRDGEAVEAIRRHTACRHIARLADAAEDRVWRWSAPETT